jgi:hypothetical protein
MKSKRLQQNTNNQAEDGGIYADAESQDKDRGNGKPRRLEQQTELVTQGWQEAIHGSAGFPDVRAAYMPADERSEE